MDHTCIAPRTAAVQISNLFLRLTLMPSHAQILEAPAESLGPIYGAVHRKEIPFPSALFALHKQLPTFRDSSLRQARYTWKRDCKKCQRRLLTLSRDTDQRTPLRQTDLNHSNRL